MRTPILILASLLLLYGCGAQNTRPTAKAEPDAQARAYLQAQDYGAAAAAFLSAAELKSSEPQQALHYRLRAVDAYLEAGLFDRAVSLFNQLHIPAADPVAAYHATLLQVKLALHDDQPERALALLREAAPASPPPYLQAERLRLTARTREATQDYIAAVKQRVALDPLLQAPADRRANTEHIWTDLQALPADALEAAATDGEATLTGWIELALIDDRLLFQPEQLQQALADWQQHYPRHPARPDIIDRIQAQARSISEKPAAIALLLPFTGPYKRASEAIREGFLSAWYASGEYQPEVRIYDANALNINAAYRRAVQEGAGLVIGPLEKSAIRNLVAAGGIRVTTLALNRIDADTGEAAATGTGDPDLYQFALAPEDEVDQIAATGLIEGFNRALVIAPANDWGARLSSTFDKDWRGLGGRVLEDTTYDPEGSDFITPVKRLLNIDSSEARIGRLRRVLSRNIIGASRRRQDAQFIYMAAQPLSGRQIVPQFRFFRVNDLPIYSTSQVYTGNPAPDLDADMNGVEFTDIPWVLRPPAARPPIQRGIEDNWSSQSSPYRRLYAFGVDAFRLIPQLARLSLRHDYRYEGQTGKLSMGGDGGIHRELRWARFNDGVPVPVTIGGGG